MFEKGAKLTQKEPGAKKRQARSERPRPPLREEIAGLDASLLTFLELQCRLRGLIAREADLAWLAREWKEQAIKAGCRAQPLNQLYELLASASFATHAAPDKEHEKWRKHLHSKYALESLIDLDRRIQSDLAKRAKLLGKLCGHGHISVEDEKFLREHWQNAVARRAGDNTVAGQVFIFLQGLGANCSAASEKIASEPYALYSSRRALDFCMRAPLDSLACSAWLYLAAATGQPLELNPAAQNEAIEDLLHILGQLGARRERSGDAVLLQAAPPLGRPDIVAQAGGCPFNLYLLICHYLGAGSRVKIIGDSALQLLDISFLRKILPSLGARLVHMIPKSSGLPCRIECSGMLPPAFHADSGIPADFILALLLCAPFYERQFAVDLSAIADRERIFAALLPIFEQAGVSCNLVSSTLNFAPGQLLLPQKPLVPMDLGLAGFLLAMAQACGGDIQLAGELPAPGVAAFAPESLQRAGVKWSRLQNGLQSLSGKALHSFNAGKLDLRGNEKAAPVPALFCCLAAIAALTGGSASLPENIVAMANENGFFDAAGLGVDVDGRVEKSGAKDLPVWNAPDANWAMALGLAALVNCRRPKIQLSNPAITRKAWIPFWQFLNLFTRPLRQAPEDSREAVKKSRRIRTGAIAIPPQIREEDWER